MSDLNFNPDEQQPRQPGNEGETAGQGTPQPTPPDAREASMPPPASAAQAPRSGWGAGAPPPQRPPWPPQPPPPGYGYYPPNYGGYPPPPPPPRAKKSNGFLKFLLILFCLVGLITLVVAGAGIFFGREHAGPLTAGGRVGVLRIEGVIGQSDDTQYWIDTLKDFQTNDRVKAVVLRINSPGGAVGASQEMHEMVAKLRDREHKPVLISMGDVAASGGYYIACAANRIMALRGTLTGSVGVIFSKPQISELTKKIGYETEIVKSGRFKDAGSPTRSMTPQERQMFDYLIDNTFQQFLSDILKFRTERIGAAAQKLSPEKWVAYQFAVPPQKNAETLLRQIADGRVYTGEQALELGLIDEIGTLEDAIAAAGEAAGIGSKPSVYEPKRKRSLQEFLESRVNDLLPQAHAGLQYMMQMP